MRERLGDDVLVTALEIIVADDHSRRVGSAMSPGWTTCFARSHMGPLPAKNPLELETDASLLIPFTGAAALACTRSLIQSVLHVMPDLVRDVSLREISGAPKVVQMRRRLCRCNAPIRA